VLWPASPKGCGPRLDTTYTLFVITHFMPCPNCHGNNRSVGFEGGDEISCKHCGLHLVLKEGLVRRWEKCETIE